VDDEFLLMFPVFALLFKDGTGIILLDDGVEKFLPLFTDSDGVQTYLERSGIEECAVMSISSPAALSAFLQNPPSRGGKLDVERVMIDPIDSSPRTVTVFPIRQILASLPA
jgi:hypothetical protein